MPGREVYRSPGLLYPRRLVLLTREQAEFAARGALDAIVVRTLGKCSSCLCGTQRVSESRRIFAGPSHAESTTPSRRCFLTDQPAVALQVSRHLHTCFGNN